MAAKNPSTKATAAKKGSAKTAAPKRQPIPDGAVTPKALAERLSANLKTQVTPRNVRMALKDVREQHGLKRTVGFGQVHYLPKGDPMITEVTNLVKSRVAKRNAEPQAKKSTAKTTTAKRSSAKQAEKAEQAA